ncbi:MULTISPECIES: amino acid ABC transporter permease [Paraburkholderia]|uniref:Glutamate/aspartate import permease protein GltJ n=1 Tax=Paraburkholderia nemoris TaxID=2793076 RepID=A0ABM8T685_9BURK|nr:MULTISPECIES: amino acid ABC transporter permease [Paraburkholderia]KPD15260.1 ABC transporter permease [Burkholderia sp. ST111]MBK3744475.1 amino acid ABC transporter permease [Paraburkholderia aspalathi]MBK5185656.1 amino acid ABC transporter permease [Burkholderia sp. R-69749]SOF01094.1 amino acid ABC transporter membrane protein, PAAT family [Burkholderia sp. OK233]MBK3816412.1 amino acid ABC transporter permease [Paraburkholderia aspalathi]
MLSLNFSSVLQGQYLHWFLLGMTCSLLLFALSWVIGFLLSLVVAAVRSSGVRFVEAAAAAFVGYHRNVPELVQLFVWYFGVPQLLPATWQQLINNTGNSEFIFAAVALSLNAAAYMSEDLRSGIRSLPSAQLEAARALGLSYVSSMRKVILPQALKVAVPPLISQSLGLFKSTSLAMAIGVAEMTYASQQVENASFRTFEAFAVASIFYWAVSFVIMGLGNVWSKRLNTDGAR